MPKIEEKLNRFFEEIQTDEFLKMRGLGNEVPYFIFDYNPADELIVRNSIHYFTEKISINIKVLNLFQLLLDLFEDIGIEGLKQYEEDEGTEELFEALRPTLEEEALVDKIQEETQGAQIVFITGIGSVYPLIRAHELLNQMHARITNIPVVIFYPGEYTERGLSLYNKFPSNSYYRAFSI